MSGNEMSLGAAVLLFGVLGVGTCAVQHATREEVEACVTGKGMDIDTTTYTDKDGGYHTSTTRTLLVYTDQGTFENTSAIFLGKWGSEDLQGSIREDHRYLFDTYGFDLPGDMSHPNIVGINKDLGICGEGR